MTPLDVMLRTMRDHAAADRWDEAAKVAALAAPFVHPRLAAVDLKAESAVTIRDVSAEPLSPDEWERKYVVQQ